MKNYLFLISFFAFISQTSAQSLKVFILAGQSNMEGHGMVYNASTNGTLEHFLDNDATNEFENLRETNGDFVEREDVWIRFNRNSDELLTGNLNIGYGAFEEYLGPEYGFGFQVGDYYDEQVLIIKAAWGGKSLAVDFRPPSSGGTTGFYYNQILTDVQAALDNIENDFPEYNNETVEIVGFGWHQGWNDGEEDEYLQTYQANMVNFISDMRTDLNAPNMQFVIGNTGIGGFDLSSDGWTNNLQTFLIPAQAGATENDENTALADTRAFWRELEESPEDELHHWNKNGETYLKIGNEMGLRMRELIEANLVSSNENYTAESINIYPNPASDFIYFENLPQEDVYIYDIFGRLLKTVSSGQSKVFVGDMSAGIYTLVTGKGTVRVLKN